MIWSHPREYQVLTKYNTKHAMSKQYPIDYLSLGWAELNLIPIGKYHIVCNVHVMFHWNPFHSVGADVLTRYVDRMTERQGDYYIHPNFVCIVW